VCVCVCGIEELTGEKEREREKKEKVLGLRPRKYSQMSTLQRNFIIESTYGGSQFTTKSMLSM